VTAGLRQRVIEDETEMSVVRWMLTIVLIFLLGTTQSYSQILGPSGSGGKSLQVVLAWADAINSDGRLNGINADIIIRPDHIIVSRAGVKPEGNAIENECLKRLSIGGQLSITPSNAQAIKDCRMHAMAAGFTEFVPRSCKYQLTN
jgi:hypothetical protein